MRLQWSDQALDDIERLADFLMPVAPEAAQRVRERLLAAPTKLIAFPRIGSPLPNYHPREVRRILVGDYDMRYEIVGDLIEVVDIWHVKEDRPFGPDA